MKTNPKICLLTFLAFYMLQKERVGAQLVISGEIRPRAELRHGFKSLIPERTDPAFFVEQRSRVNFSYTKEALQFYISAQDVRIWGNTSQIYKYDPAVINAYEAWAEYSFSEKTAIRIGRQALNYDNARFLGDLDWAQQGRSHDLLLFKYQDSTYIDIHVGAAFNQNVPLEPSKLSGTVYEGLDNYKTMQFAWIHKRLSTSDFSILLLNDGRQYVNAINQATQVFFRQTYGFVGQKGLSSLLDGNVELYYQGGRDPQGVKVSAWLFSTAMTYKTRLSPLTLGYDYLSGTGPGTTINTSFQPLYGTNHKFYGLMDYFYVGSNHGNAGRTAGLQDLFLKTNIAINSKNRVLLHFHHSDPLLLSLQTSR
ncbi:alginate export family protein [Anditalea andensis]|uniref:alginate export family protein n=1 Tax=Anditalea andensis TaxID=1048983 RepID=UPI00068CFC20|nr:alginate export family protein [Anditalea andensis]